jgi:Dyp-type peroxidase family
MSAILTPQQLLPNPQSAPGKLELDLDEIQGDVLIGLQKFFEQFVFFKITDVATFKRVLRNTIAKRITTTRTVHQREFELAELKNEGRTEKLPLVGLNVGFSSSGIASLAGVDLGDDSFNKGAKTQAPSLNDPLQGDQLSTWLEAYLAENIDGVFLVTGGTKDAVDGEAEKVLNFLGNSVQVLVTEHGQSRPGAERGHEHFGWLDGISQPGIKGLTIQNPGQDMLDPGLFVFGYPPTATPPLPWMANGSFMVFHRLEQLVPEFNQFLLSQAQALGIDPVLLGARVVGRWQSGAPLALTPSQDDITIGGNPSHNNDFDNSDDQAQRRCPFAAHIRKTNPRKDIPEQFLDIRRIIRAGIPFGPEVTPAEAAAGKTEAQRGLLFVCYQTSIPAQFKFVQISWANNPDFVFGKSRPNDPAVPVKPVGIDPIIGQSASPNRARTTDEPVPNYPTGNVSQHAQHRAGLRYSDGRWILLRPVAISH